MLTPSALPGILGPPEGRYVRFRYLAVTVSVTYESGADLIDSAEYGGLMEDPAEARQAIEEYEAGAYGRITATWYYTNNSGRESFNSRKIRNCLSLGQKFSRERCGRATTLAPSIGPKMTLPYLMLPRSAVRIHSCFEDSMVLNSLSAPQADSPTRLDGSRG